MINRETALEWAREANKFHIEDAEFFAMCERLVNRAYAEGVRDTQRKMRGEMDNGDIDWRGCNEI